ncbi:MAG: hypothetical protein ACXWYS_08980, partial [Gaiellaceae bacterium]
ISWGWGFFNEQARDPDKLGAACTWLWARDRSLCDATALSERFAADLRAGQIDLPGGVRCALGDATITTNEIAAVARVTRDADAALTILFARLVEQRAVSIGSGDVRGAERAIVERRFGGSRVPYLAALAVARASSAVALGAIADELRREALLPRLRVPAPTAGAVAEFAATYAAVQLRDIPGSGDLAGIAPETPLALLPPVLARPVIVRALLHASRADAYRGWAERRQTAALDEVRCTRDRLPTVGAVLLTSWMPFLAPLAGR